MIEGKTIAYTIGEDWIVFTDGSAIELYGGYEGDGGWDERPGVAVSEHERELAEREAQAELRRAEQEAWMMRTCDERAEIRAEWEAAHPRTHELMGLANLAEQVEDAMLSDFNRTAFGDAPTVMARCTKCGERTCINARPVARDASPYWRSAVIRAFPVEPGAKRGRARRS